MSKYVIFNENSGYGRLTYILKDAIVGFRPCDPRVMGCHLILENGSTHFLNGVTLEEAKKAYEDTLSST